MKKLLILLALTGFIIIICGGFQPIKTKPIVTNPNLVVVTNPVSNIDASSAKLNGTIENLPLDGINIFIQKKGFYWSTTNPDPKAGGTDVYKIQNNSSNKNFSNDLPTVPGTIYYVRAFALRNPVNNIIQRIQYGAVLSFTTLSVASTACPVTVTDIDGNVYTTVMIGGKCWMKENLKTATYNDGTPILTGLNNTAWSTTTTGAYANYNNDTKHSNLYGKLYNWYAVNTGKLAPAGWHIPNDADWDLLVNSLGGSLVAGNKMKIPELWKSPNAGANNISQFTGLPTGVRAQDGTYTHKIEVSHYWSATERDATLSYNRSLNYNYSNAFYASTLKGTGCSIRCVKD